MTNTKKLALLSLLPLALAGTAAAEPQATVNDAYGLAEQAVAHIRAVGPDRAFKDFSAQNSQWQKRGLYVYVVKFDGTVVANGANKALVGANMIDAKDATGKPYLKNLTVLVKDWSMGGVEYVEPNAATQQGRLKSSYALRIPYYDGLVAVSALEPSQGLLAAGPYSK